MAKRGKHHKSDKQRKHAKAHGSNRGAYDFEPPRTLPAQLPLDASGDASTGGSGSPWQPGGGATPTLAPPDPFALNTQSDDDDDGGTGQPFNTAGGRTPMLARHLQPPQRKGAHDKGSRAMPPLFAVTPHHTHERKIKGFGWTRDIPDARDHLYAAPLFLDLPTRYSLRDDCPAVYDQRQSGSCAANAIAAAIQFERMRQRLAHADRVPSRLFIYYNQRSIEHDVSQDRGAQIRDGIKSVAALGTCFEGSRKNEWPYNETLFAQMPPKPCYAEALHDRCIAYSRLQQQLDQLRGCIASGWPFVFGFTCYESIESAGVAHSGVLSLPRKSEHVVGGHAALAVGYDDASATFEVRNSWGTDWGDGGYFSMPYSYLTNPNLSGDFWTIRLVSKGD
ncbi:C1 family peptidase [Paraburkholderia sp. D15]|uniref:C1 family peptidase n=1 Tax=Paraburkholderia sp. D15 TaxID=2880218 RepID=UPI00247A6808|nr:C1 family peptidase [Paraburkholderia sp. D15]WGS53776.1 C1 family peptidase [Paraburkholderia sp. D15]